MNFGKLGLGRDKRSVVNRRAFLRGAGSLAIGLPFLESLPGRSAWAQSAEPIFSFFMCHSCGVVDDDFWPGAGAITADSLSGKAVSPLAPYASRLLIVRGINFPRGGGGCGHADGLCKALTGVVPTGGGNNAMGAGPSIDTDIANALNAGGVPPLTMYAGVRAGYINERLSFTGAGQVRAPESNPYQVYRDLLGLAPNATSGGTTSPSPMETPPQAMNPDTQAVVDELAARRNSVNDYVREELNNIKAQSVLSRSDRDRLDLHLSLIRDLETTMDSMGMIDDAAVLPVVGGGPLSGCTTDGLNEADFDEFSGGRAHTANGTQEQVSLLHMSLTAFAFACNLNRTATLQVGDGTDATVYDVPSNARGWRFHHISHRIENDGSVGNDQQAVDAHREIDVLRMETFKQGLDKFAEYTTASGTLFDNSIVMWLNHVADGPSHSQDNVPHIIVGSAGGYFKQGEIVELGGGGFGSGVNNSDLHNTIKAAVGVASSGSTIAEIVA